MSESELSSDTAEFVDATDQMPIDYSPPRNELEQSSSGSGNNKPLGGHFRTPRRRRDLALFRSNISAEFQNEEAVPSSSPCMSGFEDAGSDRFSITGSVMSWRGHQTLNDLINRNNRGLAVMAEDSLSTRASPYPASSDQSSSLNNGIHEAHSSNGNSSGNSSTTINVSSHQKTPIVFDERHTISFSSDLSSPPPFGPPPFGPPPPLPLDLELMRASQRPPPPIPKRPESTEKPALATSTSTNGSSAMKSPSFISSNDKHGAATTSNNVTSFRQHHHLSGSVARKLGHAKTRSLDYKYALAQLPSTDSVGSAKSTSLTRGVFLNKNEDDETQEQRFTNAQGVIRQLTEEIEAVVTTSHVNGGAEGATTTMMTNSEDEEDSDESEEYDEEEETFAVAAQHRNLSSSSDKANHQHLQRGGVDGEEVAKMDQELPSHSSSLHSSLPSPFSSSSAAAKELDIVGEECSSVSSSTTRTASRQHVDLQCSVQKRMVPPILELPSTSTQSTPQKQYFYGRRSNSMETIRVRQKHTKAAESVDLRHRTLTQLDSIDPITRDLELKIQEQSDTLRANATDSSLNSPGTPYMLSAGVSRARNLFRSCGNTASGFFRNAMQKARGLRAREFSERSDSAIVDDATSVSSQNSSSLQSTLVATTTQATIVPSSSTHTVPVIVQPVIVQPHQQQQQQQPQVICRPRNTKKGPFDFERMKLVQEMNNEHTGSIWVIKFSPCGRALATAGQDCIVRIWVLRQSFVYFAKKRREYNKDQDLGDDDAFPMASHRDEKDLHNTPNSASGPQNSQTFISSATPSVSTQSTSSSSMMSRQMSEQDSNVFAPKPFSVYRGHTADIVDLDWSRGNDFYLLTAGMDKAIKLWHLFVGTCLGHFTHPDSVSCVGFLPKDSRYFISGCFDGKIRLWSIHDKKVVVWNEVEQAKFITALTFVKNGKFVVIGTYIGRCFFYTTDQLKYQLIIDVRSSSGRSLTGHRICSLDHNNHNQLLVSTQDSRVRMYDLRDMEITCKFKGAQIQRTQVRASFSPDGRHIICGSEDHYIYLWRTGLGSSPSSSIMPKNKSGEWERFRAGADNATVTSAVFSPRPDLILSFLEALSQKQSASVNGGQQDGHSAISALSTRALLSGKAKRKLTTPGSLMFGTISSQNALPSLNLAVDMQHNKQPKGAAATASASAAHSRSYFLSRSSTIQNIRLNGGTASSSSAGVLSAPTEGSSSGRQQQQQSSSFGDVIVSADLNGSIKVYANPAAPKPHLF